MPAIIINAPSVRMTVTCRESPCSRNLTMDPSNISGLGEVLEALRDHQSPNTVIQKRALKVPSNYSFPLVLKSPETSEDFITSNGHHISVCRCSTLLLRAQLYIGFSPRYLHQLSPPCHCSTDVDLSLSL